MPKFTPPAHSVINCTLTVKIPVSTGETNALGNLNLTNTTEAVTGFAARITDPKTLEILGASPEDTMIRLWVQSDRTEANWRNFQSITCTVNLGGNNQVGLFTPIILGHPMVDRAELDIVMGKFISRKV